MNSSADHHPEQPSPQPHPHGGQPARFHPILPRSPAGRLWAVAALVVGPALLLAAIELPAQLLADRLPSAPVDRWGVPRTPMAQDHDAAIWWLVWVGMAWLALLVLWTISAQQAPRRRVWAEVIPLLYLIGGGIAGIRAGLTVQNLDAQRFGFIRDTIPTAVQYAVTVAGLMLGAFLAHQVIRHLPRPAPDRVRSAWVGSVPLGVPTVAAYAILAACALVLFGWIPSGNLAAGAITTAFLLAAWHWSVGSTDVAVTRSGVQVTSGAFRPLRFTRTLPFPEIGRVEVVHVSTGRAVLGSLRINTTRCVYRRGPAVRVHRHDPGKRPWLLGMESTAHAEQAAAAIRNWQPTATG